jgi:MFS family permease
MNAWSEKVVVLKQPATLAVALTTFTVNISGGVILPVLPLLASERGASPVLVGAIFSSNGIGRAVAQLPAGWLSDRIGDRRVLLLSIPLLAVLTLLYAVSPSPTVFVGIAFTMGLVEGFVLPAHSRLLVELA